MKKILNSLFIGLLTLLALPSCGNKEKQADGMETVLEANEKLDLTKENSTKSKSIQKVYGSRIRPNQKLYLGEVYTDTVKYRGFEGDYDYWIINIEKNNQKIGLITDKEHDYTEGDKIEIKWKMDSLRNAGDPEELYFSEFLLASKKLENLKLTNHKTKFLWRDNLYDPDLKVKVSRLILNEEYLKNISGPEKAAIAYAATFVGNECEWDGKANENRSYLKCKVLSALNLGYQCSDSHYGFLKKWFREDKTILKELESCQTTPEGATVQSTFDEMTIAVNGNKITITFIAIGSNMRESKTWKWREILDFEFKENKLILIKKQVEKDYDKNNLSINYFEYKPTIIPNYKLKDYQIEAAFQLGTNKIVAAYDNKANPDISNDWGDKLLLLNNKNDILFKSFGVGDVYKFDPHFYKNNKTDKVIIICELGFEYNFGGLAFVYDKGMLKTIGTIDVESSKEKESLKDIIKINEKANAITFTFKPEMLILKPGSESTLIKNNGLAYTFENNKLSLKR